MAVGANSSDKQVVGGLYTGLTNVKVTAINPTKDMLIGMGINAQKDPQYLTVENDTQKMRVDFYLAHQTMNLSKALKVSFWLENRTRTNQSNTKEQWVNKFGTFAWNASVGTVPNYTWFSTEGARKAYVGEEALINFIKAWANVDQNSQAILDDMTKLFTGDASEIHTLHAGIKDNQVKVLIGVKDGKYQDVYTKFFQRPYINNTEQWKKALEAEYGEFKSDFQNDLLFKAYIGNTSIAGDKPADLGGVPKASGDIEF